MTVHDAEQLFVVVGHLRVALSASSCLSPFIPSLTVTFAAAGCCCVAHQSEVIIRVFAVEH